MPRSVHQSCHPGEQSSHETGFGSLLKFFALLQLQPGFQGFTLFGGQLLGLQTGQVRLDIFVHVWVGEYTHLTLVLLIFNLAHL